MKLNKPVFVISAVFLVALIAIAAFVGVGTQSLVSLSNITYDSGKNYWHSEVVVNQNDELRFTKYTTGCTEGSCLLDKLLDGTEKRGTSQINVSFAQGTPYCTYNLTAMSHSIKVGILPFFSDLVQINSIPYFELQPFTRHVPYDVTVFKNGVQEDKKTLDAVSSAQTVQLVNGAVTITNLGGLVGSTDCPDAAGAVLVPKYDNNQKIVGYALADSIQWNNQLNNIDQSNDFSKFLSSISSPSTTSPSSFIGTYPRISTITTSSRSLEVDLTRRATRGDIIVTVSGDYADTVTYAPPNPVPKITLALDKSSIVQSNQATMTVTVKNVGTTAGAFDLIPYTSKGFISYSPESNATETVAVNGTATKIFKVYGLVSGNDAACISVVGRQSGKEAHECKSLSVIDNPAVPEPVPAPIPQPEPEPVEPCTGILCPEPTPEPIPGSDELCPAGTHLVTTETPGLIFGIGATTQNECVPDFDITLVAIVVVIAAAILLVVFMLTKGRRKK